MTRVGQCRTALAGIAVVMVLSAVGCGDDGKSATAPDGREPDDGFILVPAGAFDMGSERYETCRRPDETRHPVTLSRGFNVSPTEVTQELWLETMGWNQSRFPAFFRPVESITWFDAISFCNRLSLAAGLTPAYAITDTVFDGNHIIHAEVMWDESANGYRLLTEAEWEYACRAGSQYPFSNNGWPVDCGCDDERGEAALLSVGWYCANSDSQTHDVALKAPNAWGLYDMHGNVFEWCWDRYGAYGTEPAVNPTGPETGSVRVVRGGAWNSGAGLCRSAFRYSYPPDYRADFVGLRIARTAL